jgi:uncharacterized protein YrzB (UPF0473 family)
MAEEEKEIIIIPDEDGNEEEFEVLFTFDVDETDKKYMMLIPVDGNPEVDEVYPFRYEEEGDDLQLYPIEDDEEWDMVEETFNTLIDELEFDEEEEDK